MTKYVPLTDNPIVETDRVPAHATNPARSEVDTNENGWSWGKGRRSGWTWTTIFEYFASNLWQGEQPDPPADYGLTMTWKGEWKSGQYNPGAVVRDDLWTMIALRQTSDKAAPVLAGSEAWGLPDAPTWTTQSPVTPLVATGMQITGGNNADMILGIRVWIPKTGANLTYRIVGRIEVAAGVYNYIYDREIFPTGTGWFTEATQGVILDPAQKYEFYLLASDTTSTTDFSGNWSFSFGTANYTPLPGEVYHKSNDNLLKVNDLDGTLTDRTTDLATVTPGTIIEFANGATFTVDSLGAQEPTLFNFYGSFSGYPANGDQSITFKVPQAVATDYVELPGWWTSNPPTDATVQGMINTGSGWTYNDTAYGVDLLKDEVQFSPDWDVVALSDDLTP